MKGFLTVLCAMLLALITLNVFAGPSKAGDPSPPLQRFEPLPQPMLASVVLQQTNPTAMFVARDGPINALHVVRANTIVPEALPGYWLLLVDSVDQPDPVWFYDHGSVAINLQLNE